jgi:hypothetical protein
LKFSEAMFAGFILQAADMAIRLHSRNETILQNCAWLVEPNQKKCNSVLQRKRTTWIADGADRYTGGRNQHNHWDEEDSHTATKGTFAAFSVAIMDNPLSDLAFDLRNPSIPIFASEILCTALRCNSYEKYLGEMTELLP